MSSDISTLARSDIVLRVFFLFLFALLAASRSSIEFSRPIAREIDWSPNLVSVTIATGAFVTSDDAIDRGLGVPGQLLDKERPFRFLTTTRGRPVLLVCFNIANEFAWGDSQAA